jgi:hypothetical protein
MNTKIITVGKAKTRTEGKFRPKLRFSGLWLDDTGFDYQTLVSVNFDNGYLIFKAQGKGLEEYGKIVKGILRNKMGLLQVSTQKSNGKNVPCFEIKGQWLDNYGFHIGNIVAVQYETNLIRARVIDLAKVTTQVWQ